MVAMSPPFFRENCGCLYFVFVIVYTLHSGVPGQKHTSNKFQPIMQLAADKISVGSGKKSESWTPMRRKWWQWRTAGRHLKVGRSWNCWFPRISLWSVWISLCTEKGGSLFFFCNWTMKMFSRQIYSLLIKSASLHQVLIQSQMVSNHPSKKMEETSPMHRGGQTPLFHVISLVLSS